MGDDWIGSEWNLVFTSRTGRPLSPAHIREHWGRVLERAGRPAAPQDPRPT
jgi:hypothetical protein